jgi:hypothetical protein
MNQNKEEKEKMIEIVKLNGLNLEELPIKYKKNEEIVMEAVFTKWSEFGILSSFYI